MMAKKYLTKKEIQQTKDIDVHELEVPEWGGSVGIRALSSTERDAWEESTTILRGKDVEVVRANFRAKLLARCLVDEQGQRLYTDEEIVELGKKSGAVLDRLYKVAAKLSGLRQEDVDAEAKKSEPGQGSASGTDSR